MEGGVLYNSGILGQGFNWWMGQVADDSSWRDNINPGKFEDKFSIPGWGYRYKVRIMGLNPQDEAELKTDELPWATVMYPITAGGGQTNAFQTPAIRQGNFVFGFFMDGQQQQVPVIMGILGNNAQTKLGTETGKMGGKNFSAQSGYAESAVPKGKARETVSENDLITVKPKSTEDAKEEAGLKDIFKSLGAAGKQLQGQGFTISRDAAQALGVLNQAGEVSTNNIFGDLQQTATQISNQFSGQLSGVVDSLQSAAESVGSSIDSGATGAGSGSGTGTGTGSGAGSGGGYSGGGGGGSSTPAPSGGGSSGGGGGGGY